MTGPPPASPAPAGGADAAPAMIRVENVHLHFGGIRAVDGVSLEIAEGSITGLIGPNGAGKTTLFNVIAGVYRPSEGRVFLQDEDITGLKPHRSSTGACCAHSRSPTNSRASPSPRT